MPIYFLLIDHARFHTEIVPALAASWRQRTFLPCRALCAALLPQARAFAERSQIEPPLLETAQRLPFGRDLWRHLAGEVLFYAAAEIPDIQTAPDILCPLLAPPPGP